MTQDGPPRRLHPVPGADEPPFDPAYDTLTEHRQPPQDIDAEQACLGAMLISNDAITQVSAVLLPSDYWRPAHETIHDAILAVHHRGEPVDMVLVAAELHRRGELARIGGATYLHTLTAGVPIAANAGYYAAQVLEKAKLRAIVDAGTRLTQLGYAGHLDKAQTYIADAVDLVEETAMRFGTTGAGSGFKDLSWILTGQAPEIPPPTWVRHDAGHAIFYAGKVNGVFGDPETAKTWLAQCAIVEALNTPDGTAAMIDVDHNGENHTAARLLLLGAHPSAIANPDRFRYYDPQDGDELRAAINDVTTHHPDVFLLDSLGEVFPLLGLNTNDGDEVTGGLRLISRPAEAGTCVIFIDHLPKSTEARATGYAIGSIAKKRAVRGAYIRTEERTKPAPGQIGKISCFIEKDTAGELRRAVPGGKYLGTFVLDSTQPHITKWSVVRDDIPTGPDGQLRPTHLMEAVSRHVETNDQCTFRDIKDAVTAKDKWLRVAIKHLIEEGFISVHHGARNSQRHHSIALYREAEDDQVQTHD